MKLMVSGITISNRLRSSLGVLLACFLCSFTAHASVFSDNFENHMTPIGSSDSVWRFSGNQTARIVSSPTGNGKSLYFELDKNEDKVSDRTEVVLKAPEFKNYTIGSEYIYHVSIYLPSSSYTVDNDDESLFQFHGVPDPGTGEPYRNPVLALIIDEGRWAVFNIWDSKPITPDRKSYDGVKRWVFDKHETDRWVNWKFQIKWSYQSDGILKVWKDGELLVDKKGPNTFNDEKGPYSKMGIYKYYWDGSVRDTLTTYRDLYIDNFSVEKVGSGGSTYTPPTESTPEPEPVVPPIENEIEVVALEAPGSIHKSTHVPENAIDGNPISSWATQTLPQDLILDLGTEQSIGKTFVSFHKYDQGKTYEYSIAVSSDKANWHSLVSHAQSGSAQWNEDVYSQAYGRYIRLTAHATTNDGWTNVREIKIFRGEAESVATDDSTEPGWSSVSFDSLGAQAQTLRFNTAFTVTPNADDQIIVGPSNGAAGAYNDVAAIVRFKNGVIDVLNGDRYTSLVNMPYQPGTTYRVHMDVDVVNHQYSVILNHGEEDIELARDYTFRTQQANVTSLDTFSIYTTASAGHDISGFSVQGQAPESDKLAIRNVIASGYSKIEHIPVKAIDGSTRTYWASYGTQQWLLLDLGSVMAITKIKNAFFKSDEGRLYTYSVEASVNGTNWHTVVNHAVSGDELWTEESFSATQARYVRLTLHEATDTQWAGVVDIELYGYITNPGGTGEDGGLDQVLLDDQRPVKPELVSIDTALTERGYVFDVIGYQDPNGDALAKVTWQLSTDEAFASLVLARELQNRQSLSIPFGLLSDGNQYWIRTRHVDVSGRWSEWSDAGSFVAWENRISDLDNNHVDDNYQVSTYADTNRNGVEDAQENICNLHDAEGNTIVGIQSDQGFVRCVTALNSESIGNENADLPYGMFSFKVVGLPVNPSNPASINVSLYFEEALPENSRWFKYDEVTDVMEEFQGEVSINGHHVSVKLTDGGSGDADGVVNGVIVDPSGPQVPQTSMEEENDDTINIVVERGAGDNETADGTGGSGQLSFLLLLSLLFIRQFALRRKAKCIGWSSPFLGSKK